MFQVIGCFTQEHDFRFVALAAAICVVGSGLTLRFFGRLRQMPMQERVLHVALTGVIGGGTIWTTHFIAMVAYDPMVDHAYEPILTAASLFVAIVGVTAGLGLSAAAERGPLIEVGGAVVGATVACMHYLGMSAYQLPGRIVWDGELVAASVVLGVAFGALALNRVARPFGRYCWFGGVAAMTLAICLMHFVGMGAVGIELDPTAAVPEKLLSDELLTALVVAVMSLFLLVGLVAFHIEAQIERQAGARFHRATLHDALTGLPNRLHLNQSLENFERLIRSDVKARLAVLTLDLSRFKEINDVHGHAAGDAILKAIGARLADQLGDGEFIARAGGDEFVAAKYGYERLNEVEAFAERLAAQIVEPVRIGEAEVAPGVSIGVAAYPEHGDTVNSLLNNSDLAMYRSKEARIETVCFFEAEMDQQSRDQRELTHDLRLALAREEFELNYQLQNDVQTREPVGFEVLLRWNHAERGRVSPADFIPLAEKTGQIRPIGMWVLRTACREAATWTRPLRVAVNVAPQQLVQPSFVEHVSDILMETELDPTRLELEITEASIIDDQKNTLDVMHRLKAMGVRIAMDDFGTGYSSLASLRAFPFDKIKIDRGFIDGVHENEQNAAIVRSTLLLGGALKIPVLAEGVETEDELAFLRAENCAEVQGFLFGKPMPVDAAHKIACDAGEAGEDAPENGAEEGVEKGKTRAA